MYLPVVLLGRRSRDLAVFSCPLSEVTRSLSEPTLNESPIDKKKPAQRAAPEDGPTVPGVLGW